ncbi:MAG: sensor histidine kinase [Sellimonas intestinalis]
MWKLVEDQKQLNAAFAHDLRTPLTVIRGYSDFLVRYLPKGTISQEKLKDTLGLLAEQCGRLERFSGTMKSLRSVEEIPFHPVRKKSSEIAARILGMVDALNMAKEVRICYRNQMKDQKLYLDEDLFLEVLDNLLSNANRYAESHVEILTETEGDILYLFVSDDGPGFSEDALVKCLPSVFQRGYKGGTFWNRSESFSYSLPETWRRCQLHQLYQWKWGCGVSLFPNSEGNLKKSFHLSRENLGKSLV